MNLWILKRDIHVSWLIAFASLGVVFGVIAAQYVAGFYSISWLFVSFVLIFVGFWRHRLYVIPLVLFAGGLLGLWWGSIDQREILPFKAVAGHSVTLIGSVIDDPDLGKDSELVIRLSTQSIDNHEITGSVWVSTATKYVIKRGDIVTVQGKMADGFGSFAGSMYRANVVGVQRSSTGDVAGSVRDQFADTVRKAIPEPQASLGIGYLVGQRRALPAELDDALRVAGLTHIIVASGYNLTILVRLARRLFEKVSKFMSAFFAGSMIVAFVAITGMSPSMSRAGLVAGLSLLAWYYGRNFHPLVLLSFAAAVTLLFNPSFGWNDLGWQLSFASFGGVMILAPLLQRYLFGDKKPGTVRQILGETIAAQMCTLPILVLAFGQFSNVAVVANLLVLPLVPLAMLLTFVAGIGALIYPGAAAILGAPANLLLQYMITVTEYLAHIPWAQTTVTINVWIVILCYATLVAGCIYLYRKTKLDLRESNLVE